MRWMTMLHSRLHSIGITPKSIGNELLDYLYSLYGNSNQFDWVSREKILLLQDDYRTQKLEEHLRAINVETQLYDDEIDEIFARLPEGKYDFEWLTFEVLQDIVDEVSKKSGTVVTEEAVKIVISAVDSLLEAKGVTRTKSSISDDDIDFLVATLQSAKIPIDSDLKYDATFISLYSLTTSFHNLVFVISYNFFLFCIELKASLTSPPKNSQDEKLNLNASFHNMDTS